MLKVTKSAVASNMVRHHHQKKKKIIVESSNGVETPERSLKRVQEDDEENIENERKYESESSRDKPLNAQLTDELQILSQLNISKKSESVNAAISKTPPHNDSLLLQ